MVFVECALFVRKICAHSLNPPATTWLYHNSDNPCMQHVASNFHKWAEAIGERLRLAELREKDVYHRLQQTSDNGEDPVMPEEPVFPNNGSSRSSGKINSDYDGLSFSSSKVGFTVSYALKMCACNLLLEITRFLRDIPVHFIPAPCNTSQVGTPLISAGMHSFDRFPEHSRKYSNTSVASSETDYLHPRQLPMEMRMSQYGSNLSVEDTEGPDYQKTQSVDEYATNTTTAASNTNPRKSRKSVYLHISQPSKGISRKMSTKRQSRLILVSEGNDSKMVSPKLFASPSTRVHRRSISSSNANMIREGNSSGGLITSGRKPSLYGNNFLSSSQPNHPGGFPSTHFLKGRRKSMTATVSHNVGEHSDFLHPPATPSSTHPSQFVGGVKYGGGGGGLSLGTSFNIGLTKLKRSAQRAFRRHGTKSRPTDIISPSSSPGANQRKKIRKASASESYSQRSSVFITSQMEECRGDFPWLDIVEHVILVDSLAANAASSYLRHKKSCLELTCALKKVYSRTAQGKDEEEEEKSESKGGKERGKDSNTRIIDGSRRYSSLGSIFIHSLVLNEEVFPSDEGYAYAPCASYTRGNSFPSPSNSYSSLLKDTPRSSVSSSMTLERKRKSLLKKMSFVDLNHIRYLNSHHLGEEFDFSREHLTSDETIRLTLEAESEFDRKFVLVQRGKEYCSYIDHKLSGLMHIPFSTLIHAAPVLHSHTFSILKGVAWEALLSLDIELSQTAGSFFLLACAKENEKMMKGFVRTNILNHSSVEKCNAILKFKVLWDCRSGVWPRMEGRSQKKFVFGDKEDKEVWGERGREQ